MISVLDPSGDRVFELLDIVEGARRIRCLAGPATVRRVLEVTRRIVAALPRALGDVAVMPAGGAQMETLAAAIGERAQIVHDHASIDGPDEPNSPVEPTGAISLYGR